MKLELGHHKLETSNDDKVLFPDVGATKADVIGHYREVAALMLPHLEQRCLTLQRFPEGLGEDGFFQQHRSDHFPDFVGTACLPTAAGDGEIEHVLAENAAALVYLADQGSLTFHGWLSRVASARCPDRIVFDLDPAGEDFRPVVDCARALRKILCECGLEPFVLTTGSRGLHVLAPLVPQTEFAEARDFAGAVADAVAKRYPSRFTTAQRKDARHGRLYIDVGRNAYGQTAVLPYSLRALEGAPVATPLDWHELDRPGLGPRRYQLNNLQRRLAQKSDPLEAFCDVASKPTLDREWLEDWQAGG